MASGLAGTITSTVSGTGPAYGLRATEGISITGGLSSNITATAGVRGEAYGLYALNGISITGGLSGDIAATGKGSGRAYGLYGDGGITIAGGLSGDITVTGEGSGSVQGLYASGGITITEGLSSAITATGQAGSSGSVYGLYASGGISISGGLSGPVAATAEDIGEAYGLKGTGISISGGLSDSVTATANGTGNAYGLYASGNINGGDADTPLIISGTVLAKAGPIDKTNKSYAIYATGSVNIEVTGTVMATDATGAMSLGRYAIYALGSDNVITLSSSAHFGDNFIHLGGGTLNLVGEGGSSDTVFEGVTSLVVGGNGVKASWTLDPMGSYAGTGFGSLTVESNASLTIKDNVTITGNTTITDTGALTWDLETANKTYAGLISGGGSLTKKGSYTLTLSGANTYSGTTTVSAGTLQAGTADAFSSGSAMTVETGAILDLNNTNQTLRSLDGAGSVTLGTDAATVLSINDFWTNSTFSGAISGAGGLAKTGNKTLTLSGTNTYYGATVVTRGTLKAGAANAFSQNSDVTVSSEGTLDLAGYSQKIGTLSGSGSVTLGSSPATVLTIDTGSDSSTFSGTIYGSGGLAKTGSGTLTLSRNNSYSGGTTITEGTVAISTESALGTGAVTLNGGTLESTTSPTLTNAVAIGASGGTISTDAGVNLTLSGAISGSGSLAKSGSGILTLANTGNSGSGWSTTITAGTVSIAAAGNLGSGALTLNGGTLENTQTLTLTNAVTLAAGSGGTVSTDAGTTLTLSGVVTGSSSLIKSGSGILTLANTGNSGSSWSTTITAGTVAIAAADNLGSGALTLNGGTLQTTGPLSLANTVSLGAGGGTFDTGSNTQTLSGAVTGTGSLTKTGSGTLVLTNASNNYYGNTTINEGTLEAGTANALSVHSVVVLANAAGATLDLNNNAQTIAGLSGGGASGGEVKLGLAALTVQQNIDTSYGGMITGTGGLTKTGSGTLTLSGTNNYSGGTTISGGTLSISSDTNLGNASGGLTLSDGTLRITADVSSNRTVTLGASGGTFDTAGNSLTLSGSITGAGSLTKTGSGTLYLTGSNTYRGGTNINGGTINIVSDTNLGDSSGGLAFNGGTLQLGADVTSSRSVTLNDGGGIFDTNGHNLTLSGAVSGPGGLTKAGSGTLTLSGDTTYTGSTSIQAGTLSLGGSSASSSMGVSSGATLNFNPSHDVVYAGTITGSGHVTKTSASTLTLSGDNSGFTGDLTLGDGTLSIGSGTNLGASTATLVFAGGNLATTASLTIAQPITMNAGGGGINNNGNDLTLSGSLSGSGALGLSGSGLDTLASTFDGSSYSGTATLAAGTLNVASGAVLGFTSTLVVNSGATVEGYGTVGNLTNSGTVSPGNSIGTLTVSGNYVQNTTGVYHCELMPTSSDKITVSGSAAVNGTLALQPQYTYYASGTIWSVLTAPGGVTGTFSTVTYTATPENWVFVPVYGSDTVYVTLQRRSFSENAQTAQAAVVGSSLNAVAYTATGPMATLITTLDYSPPALTNYSLNVLSPAVYDSFTQQVFEIGRTLTATQRAGLHGEESSDGQAFASAQDIGPRNLSALTGLGVMQNGENGQNGLGVSNGDTALPLGRLSVFLRPFGLHASQKGSSDQTGYESLGGGITGGFVYRPTEEWSLGMAPSFASQSLNLHNTGGGQGTLQDWSLAFLGAYRNGAWHADAVVRGGYDAFVSKRSLPLSVGSYTAKAVWDGWNVGAAVGGGYDFTDDTITYGPIVSVEWQRQHAAGFHETGASTLGQSFRSREVASLNTTIGARVAKTFETAKGRITPELRAAWGAQWLGKSQHITAAFCGSPLSAYTVKTADQGYHSLLLDAGVSVRLSRSFTASVRGGVELFRPGYASQAASLGLRFSF